MSGASLVALLLNVLTLSAGADGQAPEPSPGLQVKIDSIDRAKKAESALVVRMRMYHPLVEVYIQNLVPDEQLGWVPAQDELLTAPLESFTVGHTIVLSRGLIDVLPDEGSLATMLAHELSHVMLGDDQYAGRRRACATATMRMRLGSMR